MTGAIDTAPVTLAGRFIRLEPLRADHAAPLWEAVEDPDIFRWFPNPLRTAEEMWAFVATGLADHAAGRALPFVVVDRATGALAGSTRFGNIDADNRRAEIGWTWYAPRFQRTPVNTEAKLLLLTHAFETWGCVRVELKTDALNTRSRAAIARIGATEEGTLRRHIRRGDGSFRDTVYFSILDSEWPDRKAALLAKRDR